MEILDVVKPLVYLSSAYSKGDQGLNTRFQCQMWDKMMTDGVVAPIAPLWSHFQHCIFPRKYDDWMAYDLQVILRVDAMLRLDVRHEPLDYTQVESTGADMEVAYANRIGVPVFTSLNMLYKWVDEEWKASARNFASS